MPPSSICILFSFYQPVGVLPTPPADFGDARAWLYVSPCVASHLETSCPLPTSSSGPSALLHFMASVEGPKCFPVPLAVFLY